MSADATARSSMLTVARRVRAYFAPVDRAAGTPSIFDPARHAAFDPDAPPAPWLDLGELRNFRRSSETRVAATRGGAISAARAQYRANLDARLEFEFVEWGKLQMALSGRAQHLNVLAPDPNGASTATGGDAAPAVALQPGSTATALIIGAGNISAFSVGDVLAADLDYTGQTGYVGSGVAAAYVRDAAAIGGDTDHIRRVTFNVGRVASKTADTLLLAQPLLGGVPPSGAKVQKLVSFLDREGGSFFQEWSALFVLGEASGGRVALYYPRLQASAPAAETWSEILPPFNSVGLRAAFLALPVTDALDGEPVLCYRSSFPAAGSALY
jgi:hypothetical protein